MQDALPKVSGYLKEYRECLFAEYQQLLANMGFDKTSGYLEKAQASILSEKFSQLLASVDGAYTRSMIPTNTLEAESRHDWDALLYNFYVAAGEGRSQDVLYV